MTWQGVDDLLTDPQIHTRDGAGYGRGNMGLRGMGLFFASHVCNPICRQLVRRWRSIAQALEQASRWLLAAGCWLLASGWPSCWLLAAGCWLLAAGCWLLAAGCWLVRCQPRGRRIETRRRRACARLRATLLRRPRPCPHGTAPTPTPTPTAAWPSCPSRLPLSGGAPARALLPPPLPPPPRPACLQRLETSLRRRAGMRPCTLRSRCCTRALCALATRRSANRASLRRPPRGSSTWRRPLTADTCQR
jgi:hypothetical protein